jgi:hypothetical protein
MARKRNSTQAAAREMTAASGNRAANLDNGSKSDNGVTRDDEIRNLAYRKWEEAGCPDGDGLPFWLAAEHELRSV